MALSKWPEDLDLEIVERKKPKGKQAKPLNFLPKWLEVAKNNPSKTFACNKCKQKHGLKCSSLGHRLKRYAKENGVLLSVGWSEQEDSVSFRFKALLALAKKE